MKFLYGTTWPRVFEGWRAREANNPGWTEVARSKGWPDWESWRRFTASQIMADRREWKCYEFSDPMKEVPAMHMGPYGGWQGRVEKKNQTTFAELLEIPEQYTEWSEHAGLRSIVDGLPFPTEFIGLKRKDTGAIVCIDGHHRATAIALAAKEARQIDFSQTTITIMLAELDETDADLLGHVLARGTSRESV